MNSQNEKTLSYLRKLKTIPAVIANSAGIITYVNDAFLENYLWNKDIVGSNIRRIIPDQFKDSHHIGFSRFNVTGISRVAGHPIDAMVKCGDGQLVLSRHHLVVEKTSDGWVFGAELKPLGSYNPHFVKVPTADKTESSFELDQVRAVLGKMNLAIENISDSIIWSETDGNIFWSNRAFEHFVDRSIYDLIGNSFSEILELFSAGEIISKEAHPILIASKNGNSKGEYDVKISGNIRKVVVESARFEIEGGKIYVVSTIKDITDQKQLEEFLKADNLRMQEELNVARDIQMSMIPNEYPAFPDRTEIDISGILLPAREVGGDFYNHFFIDQEHLCFLVGDVSGKGVPAALFMAVTQALLKSGSSDNISTGQIISRVNSDLSRDNSSYLFVTLLVGILNVNTGKLTYTNAGHNPALIKRNSGEIEKLVDLHGPVMGASESIKYEESEVTINPGDIILAYTDGVTEANNFSGELYSESRLIDRLSTEMGLTTHDLLTQILSDVRVHENGSEQFDDITLLSIKMLKD